MKFGLHNIPAVFKIFPLPICINFNFIKQHKYNTDSHNIEILCMQFIMSNIFNLIENFIDIINNKHCLIMCAN